MYDREIPSRQLTAWLVAAIVPTSVQLMAGASWFSVVLVSILSLLCIWLRWMFGKKQQGKLLTICQWLILSAVLGTACRESVQSWPYGSHSFVGITLLLLALWSVSKGSSASARVGCVLFWFIIFLYPVLLGAGIKDVKMKWLLPTAGDVDAFGCVLLLTPAVAASHIYKKESLKPKLLLIPLFCIAAAVVTAGVLSPQIASGKDHAFYEMTRSLNLFGQARRFEAVLSAAMTAGWFSLLSLYLSVCRQLTDQFLPGRAFQGSLAAAALALLILLCDLHIPRVLLLMAAAVFWVLLPILAQGLGPEKKS